ncbi:hypothetical protein DSM106972_090610 [Dulcicalothrix desertica PCC 7102]|uniref:TauD/TfdA-like domain-containing protein n=1 Tax=Dulcicalothrix desertica PCC 7102 TaxID=232991 RepID=A0A3S1A7P5_9CYAN|nr:guanitoxin biosynthesis L-enduracididine beta-hydroxylase GntD [Dulcicalothrix desertica]RUS95285.1 hypothetical protein DSM106972_090610 [Dulcicalothrix desertica PCC 7102]TWH43973.1 Fe(II)/alpha-ketoglutarate-dependent arginine beta-hydroxylase [Dulcicalothrix desertica PCC 7102]
MEKIVLSEQEVKHIKIILERLTSQYTSVEDVEFLNNVNTEAHELPKRLRAFINNFKLLEPSSGICLISGYPISDSKIGKTPSHWKDRPETSPTLEEEILFMLLGSLLGEAIGWSTQQAGHIVHNICPIKGHENEQIGSSSEQPLWWHNEDAFHPYRGDYIGLMCLRNPDQVPTTVGAIEKGQLQRELVQTLFEERFTIHPDESHLEKHKFSLNTLPTNCEQFLESAYNRINNMNINPQKLPLLYGDFESPYIRIDPYYMDDLENDKEAANALNQLVKVIEGNLINLVLQPGDFCFIDNYKAVHGRKSFKANFDGKDRWLKRINITRDLRKSRSIRPTVTSRVLF